MMVVLSKSNLELLSAALLFPSIQQMVTTALGNSWIISWHLSLQANMADLRRTFFITTCGLKRLATQIESPQSMTCSSVSAISGLWLSTFAIFLVSSACRALHNDSCAGIVRLLTCPFVQHSLVDTFFSLSQLAR